MATIYRATCQNRITTHTMSGDASVASSFGFYFTYLNAPPDFNPHNGYCTVQFYESVGAGRLLYSTGYEVGTWDPDTWYTVKVEVEHNAPGYLTIRSYLDDELLLDYDYEDIYSFQTIAVQLDDQGRYGTYGGAWSWRRELDNYRFYKNGLLADSDNFEDGDLSGWPLYIDQGFDTGESGGIYWAEDANGDLHTIRSRNVTDKVGTGGGSLNCAVKNLRTQAIYHAYLTEDGDLVCQIFPPGTVSSPTEVTVDTGVDYAPNGIVHDPAGKLVIFLADGLTRYAAEDPATAASWGTWT